MRWVQVDPERLVRWRAGFVERHGVTAVDASPEQVILTGEDGATAEIEVPFGPLLTLRSYDDLVAHAVRDRRLGLLLVRRGGYSVGIAHGRELTAHTTGSRHVQGRSAAGGWSQQRFARRREGQAKVALAAAADAAARVLLPEAGTLDALVAGGDAGAVAGVLEDPRLRRLAALRTPRLLDVPEPRFAVLKDAVRLARQVHIRVDPDDHGPGAAMATPKP